MIRGKLKWEEVLVREIEPDELASVINDVLNEGTRSIEVEEEIDGTYTVSYKVLTQPWEDE